LLLWWSVADVGIGASCADAGASARADAGAGAMKAMPPLVIRRSPFAVRRSNYDDRQRPLFWRLAIRKEEKKKE